MPTPSPNGYNRWCKCSNINCVNHGKIVMANYQSGAAIGLGSSQWFVCPMCNAPTVVFEEVVNGKQVRCSAPYRDFVADARNPIIKPNDDTILENDITVDAMFDANSVYMGTAAVKTAPVAAPPTQQGALPTPLVPTVNDFTEFGKCRSEVCANYQKIVQPNRTTYGTPTGKDHLFVCPSCGTTTNMIDENDTRKRVSYRDIETDKIEPAGQPEIILDGARWLCSLDKDGVITSLCRVPEDYTRQPVVTVTGETKKMREPIEIHSGLLGYEDADKAATLAAVGGEHVLVLGPPGRGKSLFYRRFFNNLEGRFFETQLSKFSDDSALFGAPDLKRMRETGEIVYPQKGIADAEWVGIDEIFDASDICLRTLNGWLNERKVLRGSQVMEVPLQTCIATANYSRTNEIIAAVIDRFAIAVVSPSLTDEQRVHLYNGAKFEHYSKPEKQITLEQIMATRDASLSVKIPDALITTLLHWSKAQGFSPRRERVMAKLMKVNAAMENRITVDERDLEIIKWVVPMSAGMASGHRTDDPSADLRDGIRKALNEQKQISMIDQFRNVKKEAGDRTITYVKNLAAAIRSIKDIMPVTEKVTEYQTNILTNLRQMHKEQLNTLGLMVQ